MEDTLRVKFKEFRDDGGYIKYVFQDLDKEAHFILCTKFPNWDTPLIKIDDRGFLRYKEIYAGKSEWYDPETKDFIPYKYDAIQFLDCVHENEYKERNVLIWIIV